MGINELDSSMVLPSMYRNRMSNDVSSAAAMHHACVVDDPIIENTVYKQQAQAATATVMLNKLIHTPEESRSKFVSEFAGRLCCERLSIEQVFHLLMESMSNRYAKSIPKQKCASPVHLNTNNDSYQPVFYVSKDKHLDKSEEVLDGIPVRYQGFTKAAVWWSSDIPNYGLVARRMQYQARMKNAKYGNVIDEANIAETASLFFQIFEGTSYVLIKRENTDKDIDRSKMGAYVVESAAKLVQIWPVQKPSRKQLVSGSGSNLSSPTAAAGAASSFESNNSVVLPKRKFDDNETTIEAPCAKKQQALSENDSEFRIRGFSIDLPEELGLVKNSGPQLLKRQLGLRNMRRMNSLECNNIPTSYDVKTEVRSSYPRGVAPLWNSGVEYESLPMDMEGLYPSIGDESVDAFQDLFSVPNDFTFDLDRVDL